MSVPPSEARWCGAPDLHGQQRQHPLPAVERVDDLAYAPRAHAPVEPLRVRVRLDLQDFGVEGRGPAEGMVEERAP